MWHEYLIPADFNKQKEIIRELRTWIEELEQRKLITGFAFNHYYNNPPSPDELRIRFEYTIEENSKDVEEEMELKVKQFVSDYELKQSVTIYKGEKLKRIENYREFWNDSILVIVIPLGAVFYAQKISKLETKESYNVTIDFKAIEDIFTRIKAKDMRYFRAKAYRIMEKWEKKRK